MASRKKTRTELLGNFRLKKKDIAFDRHGWMVIKNPAIQRMMEARFLMDGVIPPTPNVGCLPKKPIPPSPDGMCACEFTMIAREMSQIRTGRFGPGPVRSGQVRAGQQRGARRTHPR